MKWASAISTRPSLELALQEVVDRTLAELQASPDLAIIFISSTFASEYPRVLPLLKAPLKGTHILGGSGSGVVGMSGSGRPSEIEDEPALSLTLAHLPGVDLRSFHLSTDELPDLDSPPSEWTDIVGVTPQEQPHFILIADPFSSGMNDLLQGLDFAYPDAVKVGGQAGIESISRSSGLFCGKHLYREGVVGVALSGNIEMDAIVAQGCRPIGEAYRVTNGDRNVITEIESQAEGTGVQTPLTALQAMFQTMDKEDRELAQQSLFIGIAQSGFKQKLERGDFLIRNLVGVDPKVGAVAIADHVRPGQIIQFHLRDADTSAEDLETLLEEYKGDHASPPAGALLFACTGRGEGLYDQPNFDSDLFQEYLGPAPLGGFFCNGEIGPVGKTTFLHGFTSVFGIFRPKS
ncbi:MAG: FIST N-terminal domain-containing protein [Cyanobacteria bacterium J06554_6]